MDDWDNIDFDNLLIPIKRLDKVKVISICERLLSNFKENRMGLPDLIVYNDTEFFFCEVKSENDKVTEKQREWHDYISSKLDMKMELLLINQSDAKMKKAKESYTPSSNEITISFGHSSSKKRDEAISHAKQQTSYFTEGEGKNQIHGAKFILKEDEIENIFTMLDLTSGWKTQKIEIDNKIIKSTELRPSLWCIRQKISEKASLDYCRKGEDDRKANKFGCRNMYFTEFETDHWVEFGYIDSTNCRWIFERDKINRKIEEEIERLKFCPLFNPEKVRRVAEHLPDMIDPRKDKNWAFISNDYDKWFWHDNQWLNTVGDNNFPGASMMIGVRYVDNKEISEVLECLKMKEQHTSTFVPPTESKDKSGCFIASAVYDVNSYQVKILENGGIQLTQVYTIYRLWGDGRLPQDT